MIIGLIGEPNTGKDQVIAKKLVEKFNFKRFAFADQIKNEYYQHINITEEFFKSCKGTFKEQEIRDGLWKYSDMIRNKFGELYFINPVIENIKKCKNSVITDIRTKTEIKEILKLGRVYIIIITKQELTDFGYFKGTRILNKDIVKLLKESFCFEFINNFYSAEEAINGFEDFISKGVLMDPDSSSFS